MLDKKRNSDIEAIRRLQFNAMKMAAGMPPTVPHPAAHGRHHPYMRPGHLPQAQLPPQENYQPAQKFEYSLKEEPSAAEITEIDSGCESPQEQASPMVITLTLFGNPCVSALIANISLNSYFSAMHTATRTLPALNRAILSATPRRNPTQASPTRTVKTESLMLRNNFHYFFHCLRTKSSRSVPSSLLFSLYESFE